MRNLLTYGVGLLMLLSLNSCFQKKKTNWNISLSREDKKPYGSYLAFKSLKYYFPGAEIQTLSQGFRFNNIDDKIKHHYDGKSLLVLLGLDLYISESELNELLSFAHSGNELVIFCSRLDGKIEEKLGCYKLHTGFEEQKLSEDNAGEENISALQLAGSQREYGYEGRSLSAFFELKPITADNAVEDADTADSVFMPMPDTLGYAHGRPDFIRYTIGDGHITLHAAPLALSNYFLLQPGNEQYLSGIWHTLPSGVRHIYWNEYYKHNAENSNFNILWRYPATRWALVLAIITLLMYVLFEGKRRQRIIPVIAKPENTSVSFVETVGRLYFNKGNHQNMAEKMIQHFLEWVRLHYYLDTNELNDTFARHLAFKSGQPERRARHLVDHIHRIRLGGLQADEAALHELYDLMQPFYTTHIS